MKQVYFILALLGFIAPNILVVIESVETGNILLYKEPLTTMYAMFANRISSIFMIDLLWALIVFFVWSFHEAKRRQISGLWHVWLLTMLFGFAGGLPLFLFKVEKSRSKE